MQLYSLRCRWQRKIAGLIAQWQCNEMTGSAVRDNVGNNDATITGTPVWQPGLVDGALAVDANVHVTMQPTLWQQPQYTFAAWIWLDTRDPDTHTIYSEGQNNTVGFLYLAVRNMATPAYRLNLRVFDTGNSDVIGNTEVSIGRWHHVAFTRDETSYAVYLNGRIDASGSITRTLTTIDRASFGSLTRANVTAPWQGKFDDVRIYDRVLIETEISALASLL